MKKITLLIVSLVAGAKTLDAKYAKQIFTTTTKDSTISQDWETVDKRLTEIIDFKPEDKTPSQIQTPLFRALIVKNASDLAKGQIKSPLSKHVISQILLNNIDSFKSFITYVTNQSRDSSLLQFHKIFNAKRIDLNTLLLNEIMTCKEAIDSLSNRTLDTDEENVLELVTLEHIQLQLLAVYLTNSDGSIQETKDCLKQLKVYSVEKITLLRRLTPFLLLAAAGGVTYLAHNHGDYIAQLAMQTFNNIGQFIIDKTGYDVGSMMNSAGSAMASGASAMGSGTSAIAQSLWNRIPTLEAAKAMISALPEMVPAVEYKALAQSALDSAPNRWLELPLWQKVGVGLGGAGAVGGAGYGIKRLISGRETSQEKISKSPLDGSENPMKAPTGDLDTF